MNRRKWTLIVVITLFAGCLVAAWHPPLAGLSANDLLAPSTVRGLIGKLDRQGRIGLLRESRFGVNTFEHGVSSDQIASFYRLGCDRLATLHGRSELVTYSWEDEIGYPSMATVYQGPRSYVEMGVGQGNDSDFFWCEAHLGAYDTSDKQKIDASTRPESILRDD